MIFKVISGVDERLRGVIEIGGEIENKHFRNLTNRRKRVCGGLQGAFEDDFKDLLANIEQNSSS